METTLIQLSRAGRALAKAKTMDDILDIRDKAEAVRVYAKAAGKGLIVQNHAAEIKLRAERKAGALLAEMDRQTGRPRKRSHDATIISSPTLEDMCINKSQSSRWQKEAGVSDEAFATLAAKCTEDEVELTQSTLLKAACAVHVAQTTGENEWYTPPEFIARARKAMGGIDLDPASSNVAQETVKAKRHYTIAQDGLSKRWKGRVWLNPPYSKDLCPLFVGKLLHHVEAQNVTQAVLLVNNATETAWFQKAGNAAAAVCFPARRIKFFDKTGKPGNSPLQGQALLYFGCDVARFTASFADAGFILTSPT